MRSKVKNTNDLEDIDYEKKSTKSGGVGVWITIENVKANERIKTRKTLKIKIRKDQNC